jgi:hypothetical protein
MEPSLPSHDYLIYENFWGWEMKQPPDSVLNCFELFFWGWELKQPLNPPEPSSVLSLLLREFLTDSIYENFWADGVKQPLNPSHHPSMDEASSKAGRTVAKKR